MAALLVIGALRDLEGWRERSIVLANVPAVSPIPRAPGQAVLDELLPLVRAGVAPRNSGLIVDYFSFPSTGYLALQSGIARDRIYLPEHILAADLDGVREDVDLRYRPFPLVGNRPAALDAFLLAHPTGVLAIQPGSRFAGLLGYDGGPTLTFRGQELSLRELARRPWPLPDEPQRLASGVRPGAPGELVLLAYAKSTSAPKPGGRVVE